MVLDACRPPLHIEPPITITQYRSRKEEALRLPGMLQEADVASVHCLINNAGIADPYMPEGAGPQAAMAAFDQYLAVNLAGEGVLSLGSSHP